MATNGNPLTDHLDLWTSALLNKSAAGRGNNGRQEAYGIKKLRELILELAVRGKLVPQDSNDEPASVLLAKIAKEKARLVADGEIKRSNPLPQIGDEEKTFCLPQGWTWSRWDEIALKIGDIDHKMPEEVQDGIPYVSPRDFLPNNQIDLDGAKKISQEDFFRLASKIQPQQGDIIYPRYGTIGENRLVATTRNFLASYSCCVVKTMHGFIEPKYQFIFSISELARDQAKKAANKTTQANVGIKSIQAYVVPLPPLAEQHRIVAKVDELMALCDRLEQQQTDSQEAHQTLVETLLGTLTQTPVRAEPVEARPSTNSGRTEFEEAWTRIADHFDTLFTTENSIDQLKQTILQLAVMGKLVPQDPNDESAIEWFKKLQREKDRLINIGLVKGHKPLSEISDDKTTVAYPKTWIIARLAEFAALGTGTTPSREKLAFWYPPKINWVTSGETSNELISATNEKISEVAIKETNLTVYPAGTLILAMYGQGKTRGQISELAIEACTNQACAAIVLIDKNVAHRRYLKYFFQKAYEEIREQSAGGAQPNLNVGKIASTAIPLPPLAEQHRIVAKVDELMALCDTLKARLKAAQTTQINFADAIVELAAA